MSLIGPLGNWDIAQIAPVQIADKSTRNRGHIIIMRRRLRRRHRAGTGVARKIERKGFPVVYIYMFAWLELSLVGFSPNPVRAYTVGPGFSSFIVVYICMDPSGDRIR